MLHNFVGYHKNATSFRHELSRNLRAAFLNRLRKAKRLKTYPVCKNIRDRQKEFDRLADHFQAHCDLDLILKYLTDDR